MSLALVEITDFDWYIISGNWMNVNQLNFHHLGHFSDLTDSDIILEKRRRGEWRRKRERDTQKLSLYSYNYF